MHMRVNSIFWDVFGLFACGGDSLIENLFKSEQKDQLFIFISRTVIDTKYSFNNIMHLIVDLLYMHLEGVKFIKQISS